MDSVLERTQGILKTIQLALGLTVILTFATTARASPVIWVTPTGASTRPGNGTTVLGENDKATIALDLINHQITIQLNDLESNPGVDVQLISSVYLEISNLSGTISSVANPAGTYQMINADTGTPVLPRVVANTADTWQVESFSGTIDGSGNGTGKFNLTNALEFCTNCNGSGKTDLIIGSPDGTSGNNGTTGTYSSANASILGSAHNPFIIGSGATYSSGTLSSLTNTNPSWTFSVPQLQSNSQVTGVMFGFGTGGNTYIAAELQSTAPEPGPGFLVITGFVLIALSMTFKQRLRAASLRVPAQSAPRPRPTDN